MLMSAAGEIETKEQESAAADCATRQTTVFYPLSPVYLDLYYGVLWLNEEGSLG
ncbi:hypothetical protein [Cohnella silvisoli]|uniref:Uncharacterized protein n=1 Tax=Cohnella silvisoli TaxID=2873699 RepID=A0ABV1L1X9_9BACL|nr:hypothetical protein [Cohnella silvisoli]MCD9025156.1 hypothetical protein [Cohnella silvisoli]